MPHIQVKMQLANINDDRNVVNRNGKYDYNKCHRNENVKSSFECRGDEKTIAQCSDQLVLLHYGLRVLTRVNNHSSAKEQIAFDCQRAVVCYSSNQFWQAEKKKTNATFETKLSNENILYSIRNVSHFFFLAKGIILLYTSTRSLRFM